MTMFYYNNVVIFMVLGSIVLVKSQNYADLPTNLNIDKDGYCEICKTVSSALYDLVKAEGKSSKTLSEVWPTICTFKTFHHMKDKFKISDVTLACKYLTLSDGRTHSEMFEMMQQVLDHDGTALEMKSALCHMTSDACKSPKKISDEHISKDLSIEDIQKYLDAHSSDIKRPHPVSSSGQQNTNAGHADKKPKNRKPHHDAGEL